MRLPSTAEPHCRPPAVPPGPVSVTHTTWPVLASRAQYWPLFWPAPTRSRLPLAVFTVNSAGPWPVVVGPSGSGRFSPSPKNGMQPTFQASKGSAWVTHLIAPVAVSRASTESK